MSAECCVTLTRDEVGALLAASAEARSIVQGMSPHVGDKYRETPWWSACRKLEDALVESSGRNHIDPPESRVVDATPTYFEQNIADGFDDQAR